MATGLCPPSHELVYAWVNVNVGLHAVLWSRSWSRKEPELLAGARASILKFRLRLWLLAPAPAPGQTKVVYLIIIPIE
jgi:hypothetical protein